VRHIIEGKSWHGDPTKKFRPVHLALRNAHDVGLPVVVTVLELCDAAHLNCREQFWIKKRQEQAAQGGPPVLNAS
jgi:hypothetical protein